MGDAHVVNTFVWRLSIKFFIAKKGRTFFSILGISLGILLVTAVQIVLSSLNQSYVSMQRQQYGNYDVLAYYDSNGKGLTNWGLNQLKNLSGIEALQPILYPYQVHLPRYFNDSLYYVGLTDAYLSSQLKSYDIARGHFPLPHEVALSPNIMLQHHLHIGSSIQLSFPHEGLIKLTISGELSSDSQTNFGVAVFDYAWLKKITGLTYSTGVIVKFNPDLSAGEKNSVLNNFRDTLYKMAPTITVYTKGQMTQFGMGNKTNYLSGILPILKGLSITSIISSIYIVISTLQISLQERRKDLSMLRLLGISGSVLSLLVVIESLLYGILSTLVGVSLGIGFSFVVKTVSYQLFHVPMIDFIIQWTTIGWIALSCITVILVAGLIPASRARSVPPMEAYRATDPSDEQNNDIISGAAAPALVVLSLSLAMLTHIMKLNSWFYLLGGLAFVTGMYMWIAQLLQVSARFLPRVLQPLLGPDILLASRNIIRYRSRSALCVGALMFTIIIGNAGVILLNSSESAVTTTIGFNFPHDITLNSLGGFSSKLANQVGRIKGIEYEFFTKSPYTSVLNAPYANANGPKLNPATGLLRNMGLVSMASLQGTNLEEDRRIDHFSVVSGHIESKALEKNGVVLTNPFAESTGFKVGDTIHLKNRMTGRIIGLKVMGIIKGSTPAFGLPWMYTSSKVIEHDFSVNNLQSIQINITTGNSNKIISTLKGFLRNPIYQNVDLVNKVREKQKAEEALLLFSIVMTITVITVAGVSAIVLMNHTASSVRLRFRELATLRAIGTTKRQIIMLILSEGMMIATVGGGLGIVTGGIFAYLALLTLHQSNGSSFLLPWVYGTAVISPLLGLLASWSASSWASKQEIIGVLSD